MSEIESDEIVEDNQEAGEISDKDQTDNDVPSDHPSSNAPNSPVLLQFPYYYESKPEDGLQANYFPMSCATFLNAGIISDRNEDSFDRAPFVIFGKIVQHQHQLPRKISFNKELNSSDISRLISNRPVEYQRKNIKQEQRSNGDVTKDTHVWDPSSLPFGSRIFFTTNLSTENEQEIVGKEYATWKGVQGALVSLFPQFYKNTNVSFNFSEKGCSEGLRMEAERFGRCIVLFQGTTDWFVLDPSENRRFISETSLKYGENQCLYSLLHKTTFIGKKLRSGFQFVRFTQVESQVVILPPGLIYQIRSSRNSVSASYNFIDNRWCSLSGDTIHDSCPCDTDGHLLTQNDIGRLKENIMGRQLERKYGTPEGLLLEVHYAAPETSNYLDTYSRTQEKTDTRGFYSKTGISTSVAVFHSGHVDSSGISSVQNVVPYYNPKQMTNVGRIPNTEALVAHPDGTFGPSPLFFCPKCNKQFIDEKVCSDHIAEHDAKFPCNVCKRTFGTKNLLSRHQQSCFRPGPFSCDACGMIYNHQKSLDLHTNTLGACKKNPIKCGCGKKFNRQAFGNHQQYCKQSRKVSLSFPGSESPRIKITEISSSSFGKKYKRHSREESSSSSTSGSLYSEHDSDYIPQKHKRKRKRRSSSSDDVYKYKKKSKKSKKSKRANLTSPARQSPIVEFPISSADVTPSPRSSRRPIIRSSYDLNRSRTMEPQDDEGTPIDLTTNSPASNNES